MLIHSTGGSDPQPSQKSEKVERIDTKKEIGQAVGLSQEAIKKEVSVLLTDLLKIPKVQFSEPDFQPPIYNVWALGEPTAYAFHWRAFEGSDDI